MGDLAYTEEITQHSPLVDLLGDLDRDQLRELLLQLAA